MEKNMENAVETWIRQSFRAYKCRVGEGPFVRLEGSGISFCCFNLGLRVQALV